MKLLWLALTFALVGSSMGANILALMAFPARSHGILIERFLRELTTHGHAVTYITAVPPTKPLGSATIIPLPDLRAVVMKDNPMIKSNDGEERMLEMRNMSPWLMMLFMPWMGSKLCDHLLALPEVQTLLKSPQKFDLILGEVFMDESLLAGFSHYFKAPIVGIQPTMVNIWPNYIMSNPSPAAYIPDVFLGYGPKMTLLQRAHNFIFTVVAELMYIHLNLRGQDAIMRKYFGDDLPPIHDIIRNTSLVLVNHHHSLAFPRPYVPNMIEIGGIHIDKPKPLPKDLQDFMDNSKDGVILFSLGSNLKSDQIPEEMRNGILRAFSRMKQNVLWKFESELPNQPKNVRISSWLPQSDILAHPNMKLFITHGGMLSTTEAVERGVPVVGIPIFADQPANMKQTTNAGFGLTLNYDDITEETLYNTVMEVINNPKYSAIVKEKSKLLNDNPKTQVDTAIWWIEYVIRHKGASHLRSSASDLAWYQLYLLDVFALLTVGLIAIVAVTVYITKALLRKICRLTCSKNKKQEKKKNVKKDN